jgi:predicted dehydrogenase
MTDVALIGCGRWGANILRDLIALGADVDVVEPHPERALAAMALGARSVLTDPAALDRCEGVVVATPADTHRRAVESVLHLGVPVFVEKPPCASVGDVDALRTIGAGRVFVMHKWRYHPGVVALQEIAASGVLGTTRALRTIRVGPDALPRDVDVVWHLGVHDLSIALAVVGSVGLVDSFTSTSADDGRALTCSGTLVAGDVVHHLQLGAEQPTRQREIQLIGAAGRATLRSPESPVIHLETDTDSSTIELDRTPPLLSELARFLAHLDGAPPPVSTLDDALAIVQCLDAISRECSKSTQ